MPSSRRVSARSFFAFSALLLFGCKLLLQGLELALEVLDLALCGLCAHVCGMVVVLDLCELLDLGLESLVLLLGVAELPLQVLGLDLGSMRRLPLGRQLVRHVAVGVVCHCQLVLGRDTRLLGLVGTAQTPKVEKAEDAKKQPRGRAKKRKQYNRRFVVAQPAFGKKRGPNSNQKD